MVDEVSNVTPTLSFGSPFVLCETMMDESMALAVREDGALARAERATLSHVARLLSMVVRGDGSTVYEVVDAQGANHWLKLEELPLEQLKAQAGEASWKCKTPSLLHGTSTTPSWSISRMPRICVCGAPSVQPPVHTSWLVLAARWICDPHGTHMTHK